ncbi:MAG: hypothetical protein JKY19_02175 [Alcanivoracaceae bacterium]|nr:hypothetical protein [Alcanivoracaceae bacterium]
MLEYVFFHKVLAEQFIKKAGDYQIEALLIEEEPVWEVHLSEDIDEKIQQKLCDYYDILFAEDQDMYEKAHTEDENEYQAAAIELTLKNNQKVYAQTSQQIMAKVLSVLSFDELNVLVADIVFAVENPDKRSICQRHRDLANDA